MQPSAKNAVLINFNSPQGEEESMHTLQGSSTSTRGMVGRRSQLHCGALHLQPDPRTREESATT
ncbi:hypothetical protein HDU96_002507, partial [Phlyctochytrium bullatum]